MIKMVIQNIDDKIGYLINDAEIISYSFFEVKVNFLLTLLTHAKSSCIQELNVKIKL